MGVTVCRKRGSSSDEFVDESGACTVEYHYASKDIFRVAPLGKLPCLWPFNTTLVSSPGNRQVLEMAQPQIEEILAMHNITLWYIDLQCLMPARYYSKKKDTVIVMTKDKNTSTWLSAATSISDVLCEFLPPTISMNVEIRNPFLMYRDVSYAIKSGSEVHQALTNIEAAVHQIVKETCPNSWSSIGFNLRKQKQEPESSLKPTAWITIWPGKTMRWEDAEEAILATIEATNTSDFEIHLEMIPGFVQFPKIIEPQPIVLNPLSPIPTNGSSVGPRFDDRTAGSLGIFVWFQPEEGKEKKKCVLTNYHVIAPKDASNRTLNDIYGIGLEKRPVKTYIQVSYPAQYDAEETKRALTKSINAGEDTDGNCQKSMDIINQYEAENGLGQVIYASGMRKNSRNSRMDWALIELYSDNSFARNAVPDDASFHRYVRFTNLKLAYAQGSVVEHFGNFSSSEMVLKMGRTTGTTGGHANAMRSEINWENGMYSTEVEMLSLDGTFALGGDSGSMVIDLKKQCLGIITGAADLADAAYANTIQDIIEDVRKMTGGTITLS